MNYSAKLKSIIKAAGWTQEQLAQSLGVTFATLNSWINGRSKPRKQALLKIEKLYLAIVGVDNVDASALEEAKLSAVKLTATPKSIISNEKTLDKLALYLTYHTNTIEGSTMTLSDVEEVIFEHKVLSNRTAIEQAEARNHQATLFWLLEQLSTSNKKLVIDEGIILGIHLRLMNGIISDAGQYRKHTVRILGSRVVLANWAKVPKLVTQLVSEINNPTGDIISDIARVHAKFEQIHPFSDGNGRTGRLLLLAQALNSGLIPPLVVKERKFAYYKYLELAQTQDNYGPLELFVAESVEFSYKLLKKK
jgi:Fic family protein/DNA-binding XRE family transcriptional regulator